MAVRVDPTLPVPVEVIQALGELLLAAAHGHELQVRVQMPLTIAGSEPEPDLAVIRRGAATAAAHPTSAELVVEVAVSSHHLDRGRKAELYAQADVPEYWVVDVPGRAVEAFTAPAGGRYAVRSATARRRRSRQGRFRRRRSPSATCFPAPDVPLGNRPKGHRRSREEYLRLRRVVKRPHAFPTL